jgi:hypothetical protein
MRIGTRRLAAPGVLAVASLAAAFIGPGGAANANRAWAAATGGPVPIVVSATDLGPIAQNPHVLFRDGLYSGKYGGASIWTFGDTALNAPNSQGADWDDNSLAYTTNLDGSSGLTLNHDWPATTGGVPDQYLPFTPAEAAFNAAHASTGGTCQVQPCGEEVALWNGPVVPDPVRHRILFFYYELERVVGQPGWVTVGEGIAVGAHGKVTRPVESPGARFPTLMFGANAPDFTNGTLTVGSTLYVFGCRSGFLVQNCDLARTSLATATDRQTWRYFDGSGWTTGLQQATTVLQGGAAGTSVFWVPFLHEYMAIYMPPLTDEIVERVAPEPWGPWSAASNVAATLPPASGSVDYAGMAHPEFAQNDGRTQYVAYYHPLGPWSGEDRWVQVTFAAPATRERPGY